MASAASSGSLFASQIDFLRTEVKPFGFHETERTNNHIKESDTLIFAYNPISVTYNRLPAMLTNTIHVLLKRQGTCHILGFVQGASKTLRFNRNFIYNQEMSSVDPFPGVKGFKVVLRIFVSNFSTTLALLPS